MAFLAIYLFLCLVLPILFSDICHSEKEVIRKIPKQTEESGAPVSEKIRCGVQLSHQPVDRILKGPTARKGEYPWMVSMQKFSHKRQSWLPFCGSSIITVLVVLTASHCFHGSASLTYRLVAGCRDVTDEEDEHCQRFLVNSSNIFKHPEWNSSTFLNDIAVVKLPEKLQFSMDKRHAVYSICLPSPDFNWKDHIKELGYIAGWGQTDESSVSDDLNTVALTLSNPDVCKDVYDPQRRNPETGFNDRLDICAVGSEGHDSCAGDSGGPLMFKTGDIMTAIGVTSFNNGECAQGVRTPGAYTDLVRYLNWLKQFF